MVESFFGLREEPFSIAPDPRFLYMSGKHREALVLLNLGLTRGASFVLLTGEIGAGKTTVWRRFLEELPPNVDVANVVNPKLDVNALLTRVFEDLRVELPAGPGTVDLIDALHGHILLAGAQGRRTLIVIDEAQALSLDVLEQLRLLTNLDASGKKLQVLLIAQPEMRQILQRPELEPLEQRIVARYHLRALSESETTAYVTHRLAVAGLRGPPPFDAEALALVHHLCGGVPRRINVLCDRALAIAAAAGVARIGREVIDEARVQAFGEARGPLPVVRGAVRAGAVPVAAVPMSSPAVAAPTAFAPSAVPTPPVVSVEPPAVAAQGAPVESASATAAVASPAAASAVATPAREARSGSRAPAFIAVAAVALAAGVLIAREFAPRPAASPAAATPATAAPVVDAAPPAAPASADALAAAASPAEASLESAFTPVAADEAFALRQLALRWGVEVAAGDACAAAALQGVACYRSRGGLALLRLLDRPALLRLVDGRGRVAHAQLVAFQGDDAVLSAAGPLRRVPIADLARWWRGDFVTFWKQPPGAREGEGAPPAWLAQQLAKAGAAPNAAAVSAAEGGELRPRIVAFQLARGLTPDGVAGPLTLMLLNRAGGVEEPRLQAATSDSRPS